MSSYHLERGQKWCLLWTQRHCTVSGCVRLYVSGSREMKGAINCRGEKVSFILFMTSIKTQKYSTRTNQHKSAALYLQLWLAPAHLASCLQGVLGEGVSHVSSEGYGREEHKGRQVGAGHKRGKGTRCSSSGTAAGREDTLALSPKDPRHS